MDEFKFVFKAIVLAALIIFGLQFKMGSNTLEERVVYSLEQSSTAMFLQESAMGGAKAIHDFYIYGHKKFNSVFSQNSNAKKSKHQIDSESEDEASR